MKNLTVPTLTVPASVFSSNLFPRRAGALHGLLQVDLPRGLGVEVLVGGVALPQALDEGGGGRDLAVEVLLALLLLDFQGEAGTEDALGKEKGFIFHV